MQPDETAKAQEAVTFALKRFAPLMEGKRMTPYDDLCRDSGATRDHIDDAIKCAFKERWVELVSNIPPTVNERTDLAGEIAELYAKRVIVVESGQLPTNASSAERNRFDDEIHKCVGHALGTNFSKWNVGDGARVGFGSGRGVFYTVDAIMKSRRNNPLGAQNLHLISLTGAVHARDYENRVNARMDADFHACMFGFVTNTATLHLVSYPICERHQLGSSCIGRDQWDKCCPTHAVIGIGVLGSGHRFWSQVEKSKKKGGIDPIYGKIIQDLESLVQLCKAVEAEVKHSPVADICNHLVLIDHPGFTGTRRYQELKANIEQVNGHLLNVNEAQLKRIDSLIIAAAGRRKARALHQILRSQNYKATLVCIDQTLAEGLLEVAKNDVKGGSQLTGGRGTR